MKKKAAEQPKETSFEDEMEIFEELEGDDTDRAENPSSEKEKTADEKTPLGELNVSDLEDLDMDEKTYDKETEEEVSSPAMEFEAEEAPAVENLANELMDLSPDVPVNLVAVIGKTSTNVGDVMKYRMGSVIDLKRPPNEMVDLVANGRLIARGELVEMDGNLGVKVIKLVK